MDKGNLGGYSPRGLKESNTTEQLTPTLLQWASNKEKLKLLIV